MTIIPAADLPLKTPGSLDTVVGVDESTKEPKRFPLAEVFQSFADQIGNYADRPLPSIGEGRIYHARDVGESYISNGATWEVLPTGGTELGYAEITSSFNTTSLTDADVTGLSVAVVVGERPVILSYGGGLQNSTSGMSAVVTVVADGSSRVGIVAQGGLGYLTMFNETRVSGLTPGTLCTFKLQLKAVSGGTASLYADATNRAYLSVRSA